MEEKTTYRFVHQKYSDGKEYYFTQREDKYVPGGWDYVVGTLSLNREVAYKHFQDLVNPPKIETTVLETVTI